MNDAEYLMALYTIMLKPEKNIGMTAPDETPRRQCALGRTMPRGFMLLSYIQLLQDAGLCPAPPPPSPGNAASARHHHYSAAGLGRSGVAEVWPDLRKLGVSRNDVEEIARTRLPGYMFVSRPTLLELDEYHEPMTVCTDAVLVAAVIARTSGHFYRADTPPNYRLDHFLKTLVVCGDPRLFGERHEAV